LGFIQSLNQYFRMKKIINALLFAASVFTMTACFDITEDITVNKDGSGTFVSTTDASKLSEQLGMLAAMDTTGELIPKLKYSLDSSFAANFSKYAGLKGISQMKVDTSKEYIYKVTLDFANIDALNSVINVDKKDDTQKNLYSWSKGKLTRKDSGVGMGEMGMEDDQQKEMAKSILKDMKYKVIYRLPKKVSGMTNKEAKLSTDKKTVTLECSLLDIMDKKLSLGNEVKY
jgi:hypothetical protein